MRLFDYHNVYFIGIGGIGMSALARWFAAHGITVAGYDRTATILTNELANAGMTIVYEDSPELIPTEFAVENTLVVYTPAIPANHRQLNWFRKNGYRVEKRAAVLGLISRTLFTIGIAGTHGKTTTSSMLAHILYHAGKDMTAFLGGIAVNYQSNWFQQGDSKQAVAVMEADEYDRSFLQLAPRMAVITSVDEDHLDIYQGHEDLLAAFKEYAALLPVDAPIIINEEAQQALQLPQALTYGDQAEVRAANSQIKAGRYYFDYVGPDGRITDIPLTMPGKHNMHNALAAITAARQVGVDDEQIKAAMAAYRGVHRRFEYIIDKPECVFVDDYAHHPAEITAFIGGLRELYPQQKIMIIFQPHLYSRTRDLAGDFARSLDLADTVVLLDIYPAREAPLPGVTSRIILERMQLADKHLLSREETLQFIAEQQPAVLATVGAGDIDTLVPEIKDLLTKTCMT